MTNDMNRIAFRSGHARRPLSWLGYASCGRPSTAQSWAAATVCLAALTVSVQSHAQGPTPQPPAAERQPASPDTPPPAPETAAVPSSSANSGAPLATDPPASEQPAVPEIAPAPTDAPTPPPYPAAPPIEAPSNDGLRADETAIYEPPVPQRARQARAAHAVPYDDTPLPPPPPKHVAPRSSLWVGARPGLFVPLGAMWLDGEPIGDVCCAETVRPFSEFAGTGPSLGFDLGVRFARHYQAFAFWEHGWLSSGTLEDAFGGQSGATTSMFGGGFRFSTHPDAIGMVVEIAVGYRTFEAEWKHGTRLTASDDLFSTRIGFGVEWRINRLTSLELLLMAGGGAFTDVEWKFADGTTRNALTGYDRYGQYIPFGIQLASHWDVISSDD